MAIVLYRIKGAKLKKRRQTKRKQAAWKMKIEKEIEEMRKDLSMLMELRKYNGISERKQK